MRECNLRVYAVGHGLCTLLYGVTDEGEKYSAVFDCGTTEGFCNIGFENVIEDMCKIIRNYEGLELLVCSHQDEDHHSGIMRLVCSLNGWEDPDKKGMKGKWFQFRSNAKAKVDGMEVEKIYRLVNDKIYCLMQDECQDYCMEIECSKDGSIEADIIISFEILLQKFDEVILDVRFQPKGYYENIKSSVIIRRDTKVYVRISSIGDLVFNIKGENLSEEWFYTKQDMRMDDFTEELIRIISEYVLDWFEEEISDRGKGKVKDKIKRTEKIYRHYQEYEAELNKETEYKITFPIHAAILGGGRALLRYSSLREFLGIYLEMTGGVRAYTPEVPVYLEMYDGKCKVESLPEAEVNINRELINYKKKLYGSDNAVRNATSTVVNFVYNGRGDSILFPGDATFHVLGDISRRIAVSGKRPVYMIAPHHGSYHTNFAGNVSDGDQPLVVLYRQIAGVTTYISANHHKHAMPRKEFVRIATAGSRQGVSDHRLGYCEDDNKTSYNINRSDAGREFGWTKSAVYNTEQLSECVCICYYKNLMDDEETQPMEASDSAAYNTAGNGRVSDSARSQTPDLRRLPPDLRRLPPDNLFL